MAYAKRGEKMKNNSVKLSKGLYQRNKELPGGRPGSSI